MRVGRESKKEIPDYMQPPPGFFRQLPEMSDRQLSEMLTHPEDYLPEALQAARMELQRRNVPTERVAELDAQGDARRVEKETRAKKSEKGREKRKLFAKIESREEALKNIQGLSYFFWVVAGIQALAALFLNRAALLDAAIVAVLAAVIFLWRSRVAAILLAVISALGVIVTALNLLGVLDSGGRNVFFAVAVFLVALRSVHVSFKFHQFR